MSVEDVPEDLRGALNEPNVFTPCLHDPDSVQVSAVDEEVAALTAQQHGLPEESLKKLLKDNALPPDEVKKWIAEEVPSGARLVEMWSETYLNKLDLTTVGTAIAHSNWRRTTGGAVPLSVWIPDGS
jgi:hypothetical protein